MFNKSNRTPHLEKPGRHILYFIQIRRVFPSYRLSLIKGQSTKCRAFESFLLMFSGLILCANNIKDSGGNMPFIAWISRSLNNLNLQVAFTHEQDVCLSYCPLFLLEMPSIQKVKFCPGFINIQQFTQSFKLPEWMTGNLSPIHHAWAVRQIHPRSM